MRCSLLEIGILGELKDLRDRNLLCPLLILLGLKSTCKAGSNKKGI